MNAGALVAASLAHQIKNPLQAILNTVGVVLDDPALPAPASEGLEIVQHTVEEITRLLAAAAADPETYCILALLLTTGLRRSELLGLTLEALDLEAAVLTVERTVTEIGSAVIVREITKTKSSRRTLAIPAAVEP